MNSGLSIYLFIFLSLYIYIYIYIYMKLYIWNFYLSTYIYIYIWNFLYGRSCSINNTKSCVLWVKCMILKIYHLWMVKGIIKLSVIFQLYSVFHKWALLCWACTIFVQFRWRFLSLRASLVAQMVKNPSAMWDTCPWSLIWEDPLEKGMAIHSSILAWRIPWTDKLQSVGSLTVWQLSNFHFYFILAFSSVQSLSSVWLFATPWTAACQDSLSITNSQS